jgi:uncharacterized protein YbaR (Trm112 family)
MKFRLMDIFCCLSCLGYLDLTVIAQGRYETADHQGRPYHRRCGRGELQSPESVATIGKETCQARYPEEIIEGLFVCKKGDLILMH